MAGSLARHDQILRNIISSAGGLVFSLAGDSFGAIFSEVDDAVAAALRIQREIDAEDWSGGVDIRVRMSLHSGPVIQRDNGAYGPEIVRAAILCEIGHAGQILCTGEMAEKLSAHELQYLGRYRLRKISDPQHVYQLGTQEFAKLRNVTTKVCTVPAIRNALVGRQQQVAGLIELMDDTRLLTMVGPGGVGKTTMACDLALRLYDDTDYDAVHLIELDNITDAADLTAAVARGLDLTLLNDIDDITQLLDYLDNRNSLLLFDNCEHVLRNTAALIDSLLSRCATVKVIATSREVLEIDGESVWRVPSLPSTDATELFLRTAGKRAGVAFDTPLNRVAVTEICELLDGLPLAIELAAARTRSLSIEQIGSMLRDQLQTLKLKGRQRKQSGETLADVVQWSHDLLDDDERQAFRRLAVFSGGFSLQDAPAIIDCDDVDAWELVDSLVAKSLIDTRPDADGSLRFNLLNTIRAYGLQQLRQCDEYQSVAQRHCDHFVSLAERARHPFMPDPKTAMLHRAEFLNLLAAATWAAGNEQPELAARIATGCVIELDRQGEFDRGIKWSRGIYGINAAAPQQEPQTPETHSLELQSLAPKRSEPLDDQSREIAFNALVTESFLRGQEGDISHESAIAKEAVALAGGNQYLLLPVAMCLASLADVVTKPDVVLKQVEAAYQVAASAPQPVFNKVFLDIHSAMFDLFTGRPQQLLDRLQGYSGGMVNYGRTRAYLDLGNPDAARKVIDKAADDPADAWLHFNDLAQSLWFIEAGDFGQAATILVDAASRDSGLRRWQDGDFLIHFAALHAALKNNERATHLIDNCRSRHGLAGTTALKVKQQLWQCPARYDSPESLQWLATLYSPEATERILAVQPELLSEELAYWSDMATQWSAGTGG